MSSVSRRSRSHSTIASPTNPSLKRSFSVATSPRVMHREKRARRGSSPSPRPQSIFIPVASSSSSLISGLSMTEPLTSIATNFISSAPPTPLFPSTSAAFFPTTFQSDSHIQHDSPSHPAPLTSPPQNSNLVDLHREAFTSLRQSVAESGEGFIRRMREWEQQRHTESTRLSGNDRERERRRDRVRGTKDRTARAEQRMAESHSASNSQTESPGMLPHLHRWGDDERIARHTSQLGGQDETDDDDDINLGSSKRLAFGIEQDPRKRRSVSIENAMNVTDSPDLFDVEIADEESFPTSRFSTAFDFPFTYSNTRSSSPFSFVNTSDDESSYVHTHSGFSSPRGVHKSMDWSKNANYPRDHPGFQHMHVAESAEYLSPSTLPLSASPMSSNTCYPLSTRAASASQLIPASTPESLQTRHLRSPQTSSEKAVAALALALANGSGSLADYGCVREAQGDLEELEAGALWD